MSGVPLTVLFQARDSENREQVLDVGGTMIGYWIFPHAEVPPEQAPDMAAPELPIPMAARFRHFKGGLYLTLCLARTLLNPSEVVVVYRSDLHQTVWARPAAMWSEDTDRWPDGVRRPRFVPETDEVRALFSP